MLLWLIYLNYYKYDKVDNEYYSSDIIIYWIINSHGICVEENKGHSGPYPPPYMLYVLEEVAEITV